MASLPSGVEVGSNDDRGAGGRARGGGDGDRAPPPAASVGGNRASAARGNGRGKFVRRAGRRRPATRTGTRMQWTSTGRVRPTTTTRSRSTTRREEVVVFVLERSDVHDPSGDSAESAILPLSSLHELPTSEVQSEAAARQVRTHHRRPREGDGGRGSTPSSPPRRPRRSWSRGCRS